MTEKPTDGVRVAIADRYPTVLALLLAFGATACLTRLVTTDEFPPSTWLRSRVLGIGIRKFLLAHTTGEPDKIYRSLAVDRTRDWWPYRLATCPWCLSFWVGLAAVTVAYLQPARGGSCSRPPRSPPVTSPTSPPRSIREQ